MKQFLFIWSFLLLGMSSVSSQVKFTASVNKTTLGIGERFQLQFSINASGDRFAPPNFSDFRVLSGPNQSTNMSFVNGRSSYSVTYSYFLIASKEGSFTIDPAAIEVDDKIYRTDPIKITVVKGTQNSSGTSAKSGKQNQTKVPQGGGMKENLFIKATISSAKPYMGQEVTATYKLYTHVQLTDNSVEHMPSFTGFYSQDILNLYDNKVQWKEEILNGKRYNVAIIKQTVLTPQRTGKLTIEPMELSFVVRERVKSRSRSLFDQYFGSYKDTKVNVKSNSLSIQSRQLPPGQPQSYDGAVGKFSFSVSSDHEKVKTNEALNVKVEIKGSGNLKLIEPPNVEFPADFEVYDPKIDENISLGYNGSSGSKTYTYLIIPRHSGNFELEPINFSYFNPADKKYHEINSPALNLVVEKGEGNESVVTFKGADKKEIKKLGQDIEFIKTITLFRPLNAKFYGTWLFYLLLALPFILFSATWFVRNKYLESQKDQLRVKQSRANKLAKKHLSTSYKYLNSGDSEKFYESISDAMYGYLGDKLNIAKSDISKSIIKDKLGANGVSQTLLSQVMEIIEQCEMARFAPTDKESDADVYQKAMKLIGNLQKEIKL